MHLSGLFACFCHFGLGGGNLQEGGIVATEPIGLEATEHLDTWPVDQDYNVATWTLGYKAIIYNVATTG